MLLILDTILDEMATAIAAHAAERGGALLGPIGIPAVSRFLFDPTAQTTSVTYSPSRELAAQVQEIERLENLEYKGIVHSHPGTLDRPSGQDERELRVGLELNPKMPFYLAPIITLHEPRHLKEHETALGGGKISFFAAHRAQASANIQPMSIEVLTGEALEQRQPLPHPIPQTTQPMKHHIENLRERLGGGEPEFFATELEGVTLAATRLPLEGGLELLFLCGEGYPVAPPLLLATPQGGDTEQVPLEWKIETPADERLSEAVSQVFAAPGPFVKTWGTPNRVALGNRAEQAEIAQWTPLYVGQTTLATSAQARAEQFARVEGMLSPAMRDTTALIAGLGSVGSYAAEQLARSGVGGFTLVDPETVEPTNLSRSVYGLGDIGQPKTLALARRLWNINPALRLELHSRDLLDGETGQLQAMVERADIVIGATDGLAAQRALNRFAYAGGKPALFIGLYAGAQGGEVILSMPEETPCYQCATSTRHEMEQETSRVSRDLDYGTGRLTAEIALGADIQHVTSAAIKMALCLLTPPEARAGLKDFLAPAIENQMTYLTLSTVPNYWFYPQIFGETGGQFAFQSLWLTPTRRPECPVCGDTGQRIAPLDVPLRAPRLDDLRNLSVPMAEVIEGEVVEA